MIEAAESDFGAVHAQALITIIADAEAFENVGELIDFFGPDIKTPADDSLFVAIGSDYRATLVAAGRKYERDADERVIWSSVTRLKLMDITRCR